MVKESSEKLTVSKLVENFVAEIQAHLAEVPSKTPREVSPPAPQPPPSAHCSTLARQIDHTLLRADATAAEIEKICSEALEYGFATVCVNSSFIPLVSHLVQNSSTLPIAVVGFPLGACTTETKVFEARQAITAGAREIDMVIALGPLKGRKYEYVYQDIHAVVEACHPWPVKVILETALLSEEQKIIACVLAKAAKAAFVKTSTGFAAGGGGAMVEDIQLMRRIVGPEMGVKASGNIRTADDARRMIEAGASRIGASASVAIVAQVGRLEKKAENPGQSGLY